MRRQAVVILGKVIAKLLTVFGSSATALPGLIILKFYPNFLKDTIGKNPEKIILITGTNGKTTTAHLLTHLLRKSGKKVFHNSEGSNMERGIASEILKLIKVVNGLKRSLPYCWYVIESDEGSFPRLLSELKPKTVVLLNIFRDQLDRYGEINGLMNKWSVALKKNLPEKIIFNADDPNVTWVVNDVATGLKPIGFSVETKDGHLQSADRVFCPKCNAILRSSHFVLQTSRDESNFGMVKDFYCESCGFGKMKAEFVLEEKLVATGLKPVTTLHFNGESIGSPLLGKYNYYNLAGAMSVFNILVGPSQSVDFEQMLSNFSPAFGRFEKIKFHDKFFHVILAKNPAGMNNVIQTLNDELEPDNSMICLNNKIADGEDVSWIYDCDFEACQAVHLSKNLIFSGTRAFDLALRFKIAGFEVKEKQIQTDMKQAFDEFLKRVDGSKESVVIVTYTCLMELQKIMYGKGLIKKVM